MPVHTAHPVIIVRVLQFYHPVWYTRWGVVYSIIDDRYCSFTENNTNSKTILTFPDRLSIINNVVYKLTKRDAGPA